MQVAQPQMVAAPLTLTALFSVVTVDRTPAAHSAVRSLCGDLSALLRTVGSRDLSGRLSCVLGIGSDAWDFLFGHPRPVELHPFREIRAGNRVAVSTPGDLLFHIRAERADLCFELATLIMNRLEGSMTPQDEVQAFRYFDDRDVIGFVDGTENPRDAGAVEATVIGDEDPNFRGGSYVVVQKYFHDMTGWNALSVADQEKIIGRQKLSNVELDDSVKPPSAHNALTSLEVEGREIKILRDNMPFGSPSRGEYGTYFIGYARSVGTIEQMLQNMFVGRPPGNYDRLLDYSRAVTGSQYFVPPATFLEALP